MKRYLVIDDEEDARGIIKHLMSKYFSDWKFCGEASNQEDALNLINNNDPDLVFMDIKIHKDSGFKILHQTNYFDFFTIMVTAYSQYSIQAFDYNVTGYLLKPIDIEEFKAAVYKVNKMIIEPTVISNKNNTSKKIKLHTIDSIHILDPNDIIRVESEGNYSFFYTKNKERYIISKYLKEVEEMLDDAIFLRVHNSHLVNLNHLRSFIKEDGGYIIMVDGCKVPVSRRKKEMLLDFLA